MFHGITKKLLEASFARVHQHTQQRNVGMISASRGHLTSKENNSRHSQLKSDVRKAGYGFIPVKGRYIENHGTAQARHVDEKALMVIGKKGDDGGQLLGHLKHLGHKYDQDSVLHKPHHSHTASLHGTNETGYPGKDKSVDVGSWHPNRAGEFHSLLKNRKPFAFGESFYLIQERSFFNREEHLF
jgi:hypothetical protein